MPSKDPTEVLVFESKHITRPQSWAVYSGYCFFLTDFSAVQLAVFENIKGVTVFEYIKGLSLLTKKKILPF